MTEILVDPDDKHILSATPTEAILRGEFYPEADSTEPRPCVLVVTRETYFAAMTGWLDEKAGYYKRTGGGFVGVGHIVFEGILTAGALLAWLDWKGDHMLVTRFTAERFEIDMEHG